MRSAPIRWRPWVARVLLMLALTASLARAAIPVGFMPTAQDGVLQVIICGAGGVASVDLGGDEPAPVSAGGDHCVFAATAAAPAPLVAASIAAPFAATSLQSRPDMTDLAPGRGLAAPPPPSRGPPVLI